MTMKCALVSMRHHGVPAVGAARFPVRRLLSLAAFPALLCLAACETTPTPAGPSSAGGMRPPAVAPSLGFFSKIKVPGDHEPVLKLTGRGAQVFRCEKRDGASTWVFRQPDADLLDDAGKVVGRHGANFSFEHADGSRLVATIAAYDDAPKTTDLRWLLMTTRSFGKGTFEGVTHVQRINTAGGMPPTSCDAAQTGKVTRIDFTSDFVFYRPRAAQ
jgi:hypothetical protein